MSAPDRPQVLDLMRRLQDSPLGPHLVLGGSSGENAEERGFGEDLARLLGAFPADRIEDAIADAQAAMLAVSTDVQLAGPQAAGYAAMHRRLEAGFAALVRLAAPAEPRA